MQSNGESKETIKHVHYKAIHTILKNHCRSTQYTVNREHWRRFVTIGGLVD